MTRASDIRSRFSHGDRPPSGQNLIDIRLFLPRMKEVLLSGLKHVLGRPAVLPPFPRPRLGFSLPTLVAKFRTAKTSSGPTDESGPPPSHT